MRTLFNGDSSYRKKTYTNIILTNIYKIEKDCLYNRDNFS